MKSKICAKRKCQREGYTTWYTNVYNSVKEKEHVAVYMAVYDVYGIKRSVRYQKKCTVSIRRVRYQYDVYGINTTCTEYEVIRKEILSETGMNEKIEREEQIKVKQIFSDVKNACKMKKIEKLLCSIMSSIILQTLKTLKAKMNSTNTEMNNTMGMSVTTLLLKTLENATKEYARDCIRRCAEFYGFDSDEALLSLNLENLTVQVKEMKKRSAVKKTEEKPKAKAVKAVKEVVVKKVQIPLPFVASMVTGDGCQGLAYNCGLFTQCQKIRMSQSDYCKGCQGEADMSASGAPTIGTVTGRLAVGMMEFRDGKGRGPIAYTKIMEKNGLSREKVEEEAGMLNITIDDVHFVVQEEKKKAVEKVGRPKAVKKVKIVTAETVDDLFAQLVEDGNESDGSTAMMSDSEGDDEKALTQDQMARQIASEKVERGMMKDEDAEMKKIVRSEKKAEELVQRNAEKAHAKEAKIASDLLAKEAKAQQLIEEKELKAQQLIEEKELKAQKLITDKLEKEAKVIADKALKDQKIIDDAAAKELKAQQLIEEKEQKAAKLIADKLEKEYAKAAELIAKEDAKAVKAQQLIEEKAVKAQQLIEEKAAKEQKLIDDKAAKEQKLIDDKAAKEQKLIEEKEQKAAKVAAELIAKEQKAAKVIADKLEKEQKVAAAAELKALKAAPKVEVKKAVAKVAEPKKAEAVAVTVTEAPKKVTVKRITIDGKQYLKTADNLLYDPDTKEEMGIYDAATDSIKALPDEDDDEIEEDGYDSADN
jgi:hypothetical protein